ncbi:MAG: N-acetylmuramoyl-L-alanine amidase [Verrucomicrobia bacterium]|nr:MAG: N-acetylmuramoyl-L-alanine amidase [Verrucomicrobiota bacterium]
MPRSLTVLPSLFLGGLILLAGGCATVSHRALAWEAELGPVPERPITPSQLLAEVSLHQILIPDGRFGRRKDLGMRPTHITIHSTQNPTGDAWAHARALQNGKLRGGRRTGYLFWHFTVQQDISIQHLPTQVAGEHADLDGPGNRHSIGIEMAEHRGNNLAETIERTAKLTAYLAYTQGISPRNVVPHYHWPREGYNPPNKNCPHFLLDNGKPGPTWAWFKSRVQSHHRRIVAQAPAA